MAPFFMPVVWAILGASRAVVSRVFSRESPMITSKLPNVGTTIFTQMSQLAVETGALNLSQGFPDFDGPQALRDAVSRHIASGHNQYAPMTGLPALRRQVAAKIARSYGVQVNADTEVTITPGATQAIFCAIQAVIQAGDEVIVFDPCYDSYEPSVELAGGRCVHVQLGLNDFSIDWQKLGEALSPRTRMIILNAPHNPSGALISRAELDQLAALIRDRDIYLVSDEVYEHLVFDGVPHVSVLAHEELYQRAFVVSSFGKTYHVTGWKTGYVIAPPALSAELRKVHQYVSFCGVTPLQYALADYMAEHPEHVEELPGFYQAKRDLFCDLLAPSRFSFTRVAGTYFQLVDYSQIRPDLNDVEMAIWMTREHGVATIPVSVFYREPPQGQRLVRLCFAKREETLRQAAEKLCVI
ncbi:2-keto-4-methylthiobutyrate aminotransferase apoenzyme [Pseudomonas sp. NFIX28]|nr:2-keto-4-methylthiobutyrate aminotransferase apoenzyme [Pseudomonas sp. NFIX28]